MKKEVSGNHLALWTGIRKVPGTSHSRGSEPECRDLLLDECEYAFWQFLDLTQDADLAVGTDDTWRKKGNHRHSGLATPARGLHTDHVKWGLYPKFHAFFFKQNVRDELRPRFTSEWADI